MSDLVLTAADVARLDPDRPAYNIPLWSPALTTTYALFVLAVVATVAWYFLVKRPSDEATDESDRKRKSVALLELLERARARGQNPERPGSSEGTSSATGASAAGLQGLLNQHSEIEIRNSCNALGDRDGLAPGLHSALLHPDEETDTIKAIIEHVLRDKIGAPQMDDDFLDQEARPMHLFQAGYRTHALGRIVFWMWVAFILFLEINAFTDYVVWTVRSLWDIAAVAPDPLGPIFFGEDFNFYRWYTNSWLQLDVCHMD